MLRMFMILRENTLHVTDVAKEKIQFFKTWSAEDLKKPEQIEHIMIE